MALKEDESKTESHVIIRVLVGVVLTFILSIAASIIGWLVFQIEDSRDKYRETDSTQELVLQRLTAVENKADAIIKNLPSMVDDDDRWTGTQEEIHQIGQDIYKEGVEHRIERLEAFHPPTINR